MKPKIKFGLLITGTFLFNFLFWKEAIGINALLFTVFIIGSLAYAFPYFVKSKYALIVTAGTLITAITITLHASELSVFVWVFSIILLQPFIHYKELKTIIYSSLSALTSFVTSFQLIGDYIKLEKKSSKRVKKTLKFIKLTLIPLIVLYVFYWIFKFANPIFDKLSDRFFIAIGDWIRMIFKDISFAEIMFTIWGFITVGWFIYKMKKDYVVHEEKNHNESIIRKRKKKSINKYMHCRFGLKQLLKNEFRTGIIMIVLVNILLLIINVIDISTIWLNFKYTAAIDLKQFVHEGTYLLILSILLSIGIMIFFFRKNLNFYPNVKTLKIVSYVWIAQNVILLTSVIIRNSHYINYFGLAYKRIGVFFFLALVIFGLITLYLKIKNKKTTYWLIKINSWAVYIGFVLFAVPDWDIIIAKHNLNHPIRNNMETSFLLTFDNKALPLIDQNKEILKQSTQYNTYRYFYDSYENVYENRVNEMMKNYKEKSWLSWNYADEKSYKYFKKKLNHTESTE
ncbi:MAG: DUF4173 domain-containing protein [Bacteroidales bacterium]|nr:DUF4173 domain-containing protein [Bacteroidales bacterium]